MLCNNELPYNENDVVRVDKIDCYTYRITNKTNCPMTFTVNQVNVNSTPFSLSIEIPALGTYEFDLPYDGIFTFRGIGPNNGFCTVLVVENEQEREPVVYRIVVIELGTQGTDAINLIDSDLTSTVFYDSALDGASTLASPANAIAALNSAGAVIANILPPGSPLTGGWDVVYSDTTEYRLFAIFVGEWVTTCNTTSGDNTPVQTAISLYEPDPAVPAGYTFVNSLTVGGTQLMNTGQYFDLADGDEYNAMIGLLNAEMSNFGTLFNAPGPDEFAAILLPSNTLYTYPTVLFNFVEGTEENVEVRWCLNIFEFCKLWNCLQTKLAEWLCCTDPCAPACPNPPLGEDWIDLVSLYMIWGMAPILTGHHIWQFGHLDDDTNANLQRLQPTIQLWDRWYKLIEGCGCKQGSPCNPCGGSITRDYANTTLNNPTAYTGGGCSSCK